MIRNIVFDMGRVLLDYNPYLPCLRHAGSAEDAEAVHRAIFGDPSWGPMIDGGVMTEEEYLVQAQKRLETDRLKALAADVMSDWWLDGLYPKSQMDKVVDNLLQKGYRLYILTNCGTRFHDFSYKIPHYDRFSGVLVSAEEHMLKPNADIYERLCAKFGLRPEECLFVDDLPQNVEGARAVGMDGYCYADGDVGRFQAFLNLLKC